jgi:hypothetical protein
VTTTSANTITIAAVGLFAFFVVVVLVRLIVRKASRRRVRVGFFAERKRKGDE